MRSGLVLIELMLVVVVSGLLALIAAPRMLAISDAAAVRDEAMRVIAALDAARGAAIRLGRGVTLSMSDSAYDVKAVVDGDTIVAWHQGGPAARGVALTGAGRPITFGPAGLATGAANRTIVIGKGDARRQVVVSRLGRIS